MERPTTTIQILKRVLMTSYSVEHQEMAFSQPTLEATRVNFSMGLRKFSARENCLRLQPQTEAHFGHLEIS